MRWSAAVVARVCFAYFVVLPAAPHLLLHLNRHECNLQVRASDWYGFFGMTALATGVVFQVPVGVLAAARLGIVTPAGLRRRRRYALVICAVIAAALPGVDPVSMLLEMVPLCAPSEPSVVLAPGLRAYRRGPTDRGRGAD